MRVVDGVSLSVGRGEVVGCGGGSGCEKSMTAFSIMDLFLAARVGVGGQVWFEGRLRRARRSAGGGCGGQDRDGLPDPMGYLDPLMPVGRQIAESLREHGVMGTREVEAPVHDRADDDGPPDPAGIARRYPHGSRGAAPAGDRARWPWGRPC